jgi:uncharacterized tellurite resistance protein B-like protein
MKLFVQTIAGHFGYFIIKKATLDKLTNELAETQARTSSLQQQNSSLQRQLEEQNRALEAARASNIAPGPSFRSAAGRGAP